MAKELLTLDLGLQATRPLACRSSSPAKQATSPVLQSSHTIRQGDDGPGEICSDVVSECRGERSVNLGAVSDRCRVPGVAPTARAPEFTRSLDNRLEGEWLSITEDQLVGEDGIQESLLHCAYCNSIRDAAARRLR
ncbi:hypothetical protein CAPTEDRAFT_185670 [Capitella teleta]|uniref:Uncharacterized protein n=1 Tax=Capitella teleta TaxID=283909 RepID=R7U862_CAPTE|nr:hypothetical protein CAPTEDRAFT_185670 [Capitella teleta]|eukprot:ELU02565.1 hypothetical protein CAPTEDRAFT_185670 [Capitella teleta]